MEANIADERELLHLSLALQDSKKQYQQLWELNQALKAKEEAFESQYWELERAYTKLKSDNLELQSKIAQKEQEITRLQAEIKKFIEDYEKILSTVKTYEILLRQQDFEIKSLKEKLKVLEAY